MLYGIPNEIEEQLEILENQYSEEQESGVQICSGCGELITHEEMTASVTNGVICFDCDMTIN